MPTTPPPYFDAAFAAPPAAPRWEPPQPPQGGPAQPPQPPQWGPPQPPQAPRPEWSPRRIARVLLTVGALLLVAAAAVFARVQWTHLGLGGRAAVLLAATAALGALVLPLTRRGLPASADTAGVLTVLLLGIDTGLVHRWLSPGTGLGPLIAVVAGTVCLVGLAAAVRLELPGLATIAVLSGQVVLPAAAFGAGSSLGSAAILTGSVAALDAVALALLPAAALPPRIRTTLTTTLVVMLTVATTSATVLSAATAVLSDTRSGSAQAACALLLLAGGFAAIAAARDLPEVSALAVLAAGGGVVAAGVGTVATVGPTAALAAVLGLGLAAVPMLADRHRTAVSIAGGILAGVSALAELRSIFVTLLGPVSSLNAPRAATARATLVATSAWSDQGTLLPTLGLLALAGGLVLLQPAGTRLRALIVAERPLLVAVPVTIAVLALPLVLSVPPAAAPTAGVLGVLALLGVGRLLGPARGARLAGLALLPALHALSWTTNGSTGRLVVQGLLLAVTVVVLAHCLSTAAGGPLRGGTLLVARAAVAGATLLTVATVATAAQLFGARAPLAAVVAGLTAVAVLGLVAAAPALVPGEATSALSGTVEAAAAVAALAAVRLPLLDPLWLPAGIATAGLACLAGSIRRRSVPGATPILASVGTLLLLLSWWARLAALGVHALEPYTVPAAAALLGLGALARRRDPSLPSEVLLPGLGLLLVPTLLFELGTGSALRAACLLVAAVAVLVVGALGRLRAPMGVGAAVLVTLAVRQLAPLAAALPRDLLLALAGVLLLGLGATYEQRHRDLRRLAGRLRTLG